MSSARPAQPQTAEAVIGIDAEKGADNVLIEDAADTMSLISYSRLCTCSTYRSMLYRLDVVRSLL